MSEVRLSRRAVKDLDALPDKTATRILDALERLNDDPASSGLDVKPLVGNKPWRRLRVGSHRVLFRMIRGRGDVLVGRVVDRKDLDRAVRSLPR